MKQEYKEAFTEINIIIKMMPDELAKKIPGKFKEMIENERDTNYMPNIQEPLEKQRLKNETIVILGLIYRDFLCSPEEKKKLKEKDDRELQEVQNIMKQKIIEKYNEDDIFKTKKQNIIEENMNMIIVQEKKWYKKIFEFIKKFFKNS